MNDADFEAYLNLLARFLRLNIRQREDIRRELRAHLEDAIEAEMEDGVSREEAVKRVLDDFGDAAELAARFSTLGRKRRWIMKGSLVAASIGFGVFLFNGFQMPGSNSIGGGAPAQSATPAAMAMLPAPEEEPFAAGNRAIEAALARGGVEVTLEEVELEAAMRYFAGSLGVNVVVYWNDLENWGITRDMPVTLRLRDVTIGRALDLLLDIISSDVEVGAEINDGILVVATKERLERAIVTRVYAVADILDASVARSRANDEAARDAADDWGFSDNAAGAAGGGGMAPASDGATAVAGDEAEAGGSSTANGEYRADAADQLMELIVATIAPDSWSENGGYGSQRVFNDVLVVRQPRAVQQQITRLLSDLRRAGAATVH